MTAGIIRAAFRESIGDWLAINRPTVPFYDSISLVVDPAPPLWVTASFFPTDDESLFCDAQILRGTVQVNVYGEGGESDDDVIALADELRVFFNEPPVLDNDVSITRVAQPTEATSGDGVAWYGVTVAVDYLAKL